MKQYRKLKNSAIVVTALALLTGCGGEPSDLNHNGIQYGTVKSPYTGRIWMDKNVGAQRVCLYSTDEECYGDYFQYGRSADGHEKKDSQTRETKITYLDKSDDKFYVGNDSLWFEGSLGILEENWKKLDGSSVCPKNFRVATGNEYYNEFLRDGSSVEAEIPEDVFKTFLKLPKAGFRYDNSDTVSEDTIAALLEVGDSVVYWTLGGDSLSTNYYGRVDINDMCVLYTLGKPIRCIKATKEEIEEAKERRKNN